MDQSLIEAVIGLANKSPLGIGLFLIGALAVIGLGIYRTTQSKEDSDEEAINDIKYGDAHSVGKRIRMRKFTEDDRNLKR